MVESVHANVLPTFKSILCNDITTDDESRHPSRAARSPKREIDFDFIGATFDFATSKVDLRSPLFCETTKTQAAYPSSEASQNTWMSKLGN